MLNIICFGDSITEGGDFEKPKRWTSLLQARLDENYPKGYRVINRGIGGNTSAQGFDRFCDDVLPYLPGLLLVEFGFNDANVKDWSMNPVLAWENLSGIFGSFTVSRQQRIQTAFLF